MQTKPSKVFISNLIKTLYDMHYEHVIAAMYTGWDWNLNSYDHSFWSDVVHTLREAVKNDDEIHPDRIDVIATALLSLKTEA